MNKLFKKIGAVALAMVMCLSVVGTALATGNEATSTDTGSVTISGLESGVTVSAYKVVQANYDSNGYFTNYSSVYTVNGFSVADDGTINGGAELTESILHSLYTAVGTTSADGSAQAGTDGTATISGLPVGSYLIVVSGSEATVYSMVIASVSYVADADVSGVTIKTGEVDVQGDNVWVKSMTPQIEKTVENKDYEDDYTHGDSADADDVLEYEINITGIPHYEGDNPEFKVTDKLTDGLDIPESLRNSLVVYATADPSVTDVNSMTQLTVNVDYTVTWDSDFHGFTVDFCAGSKGYSLNDYEGGHVVIDFKAELNEDAVIDEANDNTAILTFNTNSYLLASEGDVETDDTTHTYTFDVQFTKVDANNTSKALEGAEFTLTLNGTDHGTHTAWVSTSDSNGRIEFKDLQEGTYTLKETKAPAGYVLSKTEYTVTISAEYGEDGIMTSHTVTITDPDGNSQSADYTYSTATIGNTIVAELPSMGGTGIALCIVAGCVVLAGAVVGVAIYRRRNVA